jgi:hypothetical protein
MSRQIWEAFAVFFVFECGFNIAIVLIKPHALHAVKTETIVDVSSAFLFTVYGLKRKPSPKVHKRLIKTNDKTIFMQDIGCYTRPVQRPLKRPAGQAGPSRITPVPGVLIGSNPAKSYRRCTVLPK